MYLLAVLGSQGIVVKYTAAIFFRTVNTEYGVGKEGEEEEEEKETFLPFVIAPTSRLY